MIHEAKKLTRKESVISHSSQGSQGSASSQLGARVQPQSVSVIIQNRILQEMSSLFDDLCIQLIYTDANEQEIVAQANSCVEGAFALDSSVKEQTNAEMLDPALKAHLAVHCDKLNTKIRKLCQEIKLGLALHICEWLIAVIMRLLITT